MSDLSTRRDFLGGRERSLDVGLVCDGRTATERARERQKLRLREAVKRKKAVCPGGGRLLRCVTDEVAAGRRRQERRFPVRADFIGEVRMQIDQAGQHRGAAEVDDLIGLLSISGADALDAIAAVRSPSSYSSKWSMTA